MTWADDRGRLNHDVLANWIENELASLENDPGQNCPRLEQFLKREEEFRRLLDEAPKALSTALVLEDPLFDVWSADFRSEIRAYAHAVFLATSGLPEQANSLYPLLSRCLNAARVFADTQPQRRTVAQVRVLRELFSQLRAGISALPASVGQNQKDH